jgi:hypothetical protein
MIAPDPRPALPASPRSRWRTIDVPLLAVVGLAGAGLLALVIFDLSPPLAFNDDWMYAWSVHQLTAGHGLRVFPESSATALVQVVWAAIFSLGHPDQRWLRLSIVPFVIIAAVCAYRLAQWLGAARFWSAVAAASLLTAPLFMGNATSFMSDNFYVGLVMAVALASACWIFKGQWRWLCVTLLVVAPLQRQIGVALVPAVTLGLLLWRRPAWQRSDTAALLTMWILAAAAAFVPSLAGISPPGYSPLDVSRGGAIFGASLTNVLHAALPLPAAIGLALIPFAMALALRPASGPRANWWSAAPVALGIIGAIGCLVDLREFGMVSPGNVLSPLGFTAILPGSKPLVFVQTFRLLEVATVATFVLLFILRRAWWTPRAMGPIGTLLLVISASQFLPLLLLHTFIFDRYFLPISAPLLPLVAVMASSASRQRVARAWAALALAGGLAFYIVGEQDYLAWQAARDQAARLAYQTVPARQVMAGFEANGVYVSLPDYERTGHDDRFAVTGPAHPTITLMFASASDPRPGVAYSSIAPGRIILDRSR